MIFTGHQVLEGERLPWGYGRAYWIPQMDACVCYPVPFNLVVRWARNFYFWLACPRPTYKERYEGAAKQLDEYQRKYWDLHHRHEALMDLYGRQNFLKDQS